jgi:hypothetical protein
MGTFRSKPPTMALHYIVTDPETRKKVGQVACFFFIDTEHELKKKMEGN